MNFLRLCMGFGPSDSIVSISVKEKKGIRLGLWILKGLWRVGLGPMMAHFAIYAQVSDCQTAKMQLLFILYLNLD